MINPERLNAHHKNQKVVYTPKDEVGMISSWNDTYIFVKYNDSNQAMATYPKDLVFLKEREQAEQSKKVNSAIEEAVNDLQTGYRG